MALVTIKRKWNLIGYVRRWKVLHNGQETGLLKNDSQIEIEVNTGQHTFQIVRDSFRSSSLLLDIEKDEEINLIIEENLKLHVTVFLGTLLFFVGLIYLLPYKINTVTTVTIATLLYLISLKTIWKEKLYHLKIVDRYTKVG